MKNRNLLAFAMLAVIFFGCGRENMERNNPMDPLYEGTSEGFVEGFVRLSGGTAINGATVSLVNRNRITTTDGTGHYSFSNAPTGTISLVASYSWCQDKSQSLTMLSGERKNLDFNLESGRPSATFPCAFSPYTAGNVPPPPWQTYSNGSSISPVVSNLFSLSLSQSCRITCGAVGNYSELKYTGLNAWKGIRVKAAINVNTMGPNFMVKLKDGSGANGPEIGIYGSNFALVTPSGSQQLMSGAPAPGIWYYVEIVYESDIGSAIYTVYNSAGNVYSGPMTFSNTAKYTIDRVSIVNTSTSISVDAYVDDIDIIKK